MHLRFFAAASIALAPIVFACSSSSAPPPVLNGCSGDAGGCGGGSGGGGMGGPSSSGSGGSGDDGGEGGAGACGVSSSASQCDQCTGAKCCGELGSCGNDTNCEKLLECLDTCGGGSLCTTTCEQANPAAATLYDELLTCVKTNCTICSQLGVGDPCTGTMESCQTNLTCPDLWCTKTCNTDSDCAGIGPGGGNFTGHENVCRHLTTGNYCFPGCAADTDCIDFQNTSCIVVTDISGVNMPVCAAGADAGL